MLHEIEYGAMSLVSNCCVKSLLQPPLIVYMLAPCEAFLSAQDERSDTPKYVLILMLSMLWQNCVIFVCGRRWAACVVAYVLPVWQHVLLGWWQPVCCWCDRSLCAACVMTARVLSVWWQPVCCLCGGSPCAACVVAARVLPVWWQPVCAVGVMAARVLPVWWQPVCCLCVVAACVIYSICTSSSGAASLEPVLMLACVLDSPGAVWWFGSGCAVHVCADNVLTDNLCTVMNVDSQGTM